MSRSTQATRNVITGFLGQAVTMVLGFATRTVFIYVLSAEYLGINGLFSSILTVLNLSELGIGASITYALYKPLAEDNRDHISALMTFYKIAYRIIGIVILAIGISMMPFLDKLITGDTHLVNVRIIFSLYILESVVSYWLFAYKRTLLEANQEKYIVTLYSTAFSAIIALVRMSVLIALRNTPEIAFYVYICVGTIGIVVNNILLGREVDKRFPYLKEKSQRNLTHEEKTPIFKNIAGLFISKVSGIMLTSVDNILISAFVSIASVGIYSNYVALRSYITKPIGIVFESITAGVGDFCARENLERQEEFFKTIQFTYFWIYGFCSICLWILLNPFIGGVWIGKKYLMSDTAVFLIVLNFLLDGLAGAVIKFREAHGLYWQAKFRYLFSAIFNGVLSYLLIKPFGIEGVILGSTASILIMISFDPMIVYKNVFHKSALPYYLSYLGYLLLVVATGALITQIVRPFAAMTITNFLIKLLICAVIPNGLWYLLFRKNKHMVYIKGHAKAISHSVKSGFRRKG